MNATIVMFHNNPTIVAVNQQDINRPVIHQTSLDL